MYCGIWKSFTVWLGIGYQNVCWKDVCPRPLMLSWNVVDKMEFWTPLRFYGKIGDFIWNRPTGLISIQNSEVGTVHEVPEVCPSLFIPTYILSSAPVFQLYFTVPYNSPSTYISKLTALKPNMIIMIWYYTLSNTGTATTTAHVNSRNDVQWGLAVWSCWSAINHRPIIRSIATLIVKIWCLPR